MGADDEKRRLQDELARRRTLDPFRTLGVAPGASAETIRSAFLGATKQFHPTRYARLDAETRDAATELFLVIRRAYVELEDADKRRTWIAKLSPTQPIPTVAPGAPSPPQQKVVPAPPPKTVPRAAPQRMLVRARRQSGTTAPPQPREEVNAMLESAKTRAARFEEGIKLLAQGDYGRARLAFHRLATEDPHSKRVRAHMHWAWGLEHKTAGRLAEAQRELERSVAIDPDNHEVVEELRKIETGKSKEGSKGIFSKLLGR